jgi:hypothetical protein
MSGKSWYSSGMEDKSTVGSEFLNLMESKLIRLLLIQSQIGEADILQIPVIIAGGEILLC